MQRRRLRPTRTFVLAGGVTLLLAGGVPESLRPCCAILSGAVRSG
jgi:hypothetical protein